MQPLEVDGSQGEGGGQILRTALAFSVIQGKPVRVTKVRAGRDVPGLRRQHVSALKILAQIFDGELSGAVEGSSQVSFSPGKTKVRSLVLDMKTAASTTLVLQAVVPAAALSGSQVSLQLVGGTDVPWSPTFDYFATVVRAAYAEVGIRFEVTALRRGYFPRGGGQVSADILPSEGVGHVNLLAPPKQHEPTVLSRCGSLPSHVAERQREAAISVLRGAGYIAREASAITEESDSPGSSALVCSLAGGEYIGCDSLGKKGRPAEVVGRSAAEAYVAAVRSGATLDSNLADMLLPLLSLADGPSRAVVPGVSLHLQTGLAIAKQFASCSYSWSEAGGSQIVEVVPARSA